MTWVRHDTMGARSWPTPQLRSLGARRARLFVVLAGGLGLFACDVQPPRMHTAHVFHEDLPDAPIPAEWILEGQPQARAKEVVQTAEKGSRAFIWDCSAGKFKWYFSGDEFVHILEGSVTITDERGQTRTLSAGNVAYFHAGTHSVWHVESYVKKLALLRDEEPSFVWRARRKLGQLYRAL